MDELKIITLNRNEVTDEEIGECVSNLKEGEMLTLTFETEKENTDEA